METEVNITSEYMYCMYVCVCTSARVRYGAKSYERSDETCERAGVAGVAGVVGVAGVEVVADGANDRALAACFLS